MSLILKPRHAGGYLLPALLCTCFFLWTRFIDAQLTHLPQKSAEHSGAQRRAEPVGTGLEEILSMAQAAQNASRFTDAAALYEKATKLEPGIAELWANRGLMEHLAGEPQNSLNSFAHALKLKPELFTPLLFSAQDQIALKKPGLALPLLERAAALQPKNPDIALTRAHAYQALGRQQEAADNYRAAIQMQPANPSAWYGLAVTSLNNIEADGATLARTYSESTWASALYADELLTQGRLTEATKFYVKLSEKAKPPERCKLQRMLEIREKMGFTALPADTRSSLTKALNANLEDCRCTNADSGSAACIYLTSESKEELRPAVRMPTSPGPEALYWAIKLNEHQAVMALSRFQELSPQSPATFDLMGDLYRRQMNPDRAVAEYAKALAIDPHDPAALLGSTAAFLSESRPDEALAYAERGLVDRPNDPKLNLAAAEALVSQHRFDEAKPHLEVCLRGSTDSAAFAHALLGRVAAANGETDTAIRELRLGQSTDQDGSLHYQLFRLLRKTGDTAGANAAEAQARALVQQRMAHATTAMQNMQETPPN